MKKRHEVLFNQLREYRSYLLATVEGVSDKEADIIPDGFNNNIRWNLGHVYLDQYLWIQHLTKETIEIPDEFNKWFGYGTSPKDWKDEPPTISELKVLLAGQIQNIQDTYGNRLEEEFPPTESGMHTISQVLVRTIFHEGLHLNAILAIKKFFKRRDTYDNNSIFSRAK